MSKPESINATFKKGKIRIEGHLTDQNINDALRELKRIQTVRKDGGKFDGIPLDLQTRRFFRRLYLTIRYHKKHKSRMTAAQEPIIQKGNQKVCAPI